MAIFNKVYKTIMAVGATVISIVVLSLILLKFKAVDVGNTTVVNTTVTNTVSAIDEPVAWISIVIIALVGYAILKMFKKQKGDY